MKYLNDFFCSDNRNSYSGEQFFNNDIDRVYFSMDIFKYMLYKAGHMLAEYLLYIDFFYYHGKYNNTRSVFKYLSKMQMFEGKKNRICDFNNRYRSYILTEVKKYLLKFRVKNIL